MAISNNNVQNIKFLRNATIAQNRDAALSLLQNNKGLAQDGTALLARYKDQYDNIQTIVGFVAESGSTKYLTVIDVEGASGDVNTLRSEINAKLGDGISAANTATSQLQALSGNSSDTSASTSVKGAKLYADALISGLDYTDTAVTGSYVSAVNEADGKIAVTRVALPDASSVADANKVITDVTQSKGKITATATNITDVKLSGYTEGADAVIADTDTLGQALGKLQGQIKAMDKTASAVAGQVVTTVSEADGKVSETKANVKDLQLGGYAKTSSTGAISGTDTINVALSKIENNIDAIGTKNALTAADKSINVTTATTGTTVALNVKSGEHVLKVDNNGVSTDISLSAISPSSTTVKEEFALIGTDGTKLGTSIKVYKDSSIVSINYITDPADAHYQNLKYTYVDASGNTKVEYVDMSALVIEAEFGSGVTATDHVVHGVVDSTSEKDGQGTQAPFLTVGKDGFKISGIKDEIARQINALDVTTDTAVAGKYVAAIQEADGIVSVKSRANVSEAVLNNYAKGTKPASTAIASTDTINGALAKLEYQVDDAVAAAQAAATVVASGTSADTASHLDIVKTTDSQTSANTYTINLKDIASKASLNTLSGKTMTVVTSSNASITTAVTTASDGTKSVDLTTDASKIKMSGFTAAESGLTAVTQATSVTGAVKAIETEIISNERVISNALNDLNAKVDSLSGETVSAVKVNNVALAETDNTVNIALASASGAITVTTNQTTGAVDLGIQTLDCGTY